MTSHKIVHLLFVTVGLICIHSLIFATALQCEQQTGGRIHPCVEFVARDLESTDQSSKCDSDIEGTREQNTQTAEDTRDEKWIREENWKRRVDLAVAYRGLAKYEMYEGVSDHATVLAPTLARKEPVMLLIPHGLHWSRVTPGCFIGIDVNTAEVIEGSGLSNISAHSLHRAIYRQRPDVQAVIHTHPTYASVLSVLEDMKLKMYHQNSMRFMHNVAYDQRYGSFADDENAECERIARSLSDKEVLLMGHHGLMTVAESVAVAFDLHYYFEQAAKVQILAYQTNRAMKVIEPEVAEPSFWDIQASKHLLAESHLDALKNAIIKQDSEFLN